MEDKKVITASPVKGEAVVLNEEIGQLLAKMLSSTDEADWKMAQLILNTCDIEKSIYWIWQLSRKSWYANRMVNLRTKASRKFREDTGLFYIATKNDYEFSKWLDSKAWLTPELFQVLKKNIINILSYSDSHKFYELHFTIREDKKHFDPNQQLENLAKYKNVDYGD